jgi:hypothetical protein
MKRLDHLHLGSVCLLENSFFLESEFQESDFREVNYFLMFGSVMENK